MDRDTIVTGNTVDFDIANNDIYGIDDRDTTWANRSIAADGSTSRATDDGFVVTNSEADWQFELSLEYDVQAGRSLGDVSSTSQVLQSDRLLTVAARIKAA